VVFTIETDVSHALQKVNHVSEMFQFPEWRNETAYSSTGFCFIAVSVLSCLKVHFFSVTVSSF
jgi:hypothetical protein